MDDILSRLAGAHWSVWGFLGAGLFLFAYGMWSQKRYQPGNPPLISPPYVMITGLVMAFVAGAEIVSLIIGSGWSSPLSGR